MTEKALKTRLANRITMASNWIDAARKSKPYTAAEYQAVADAITDGLARIDEHERTWEATFGNIPSILEVSRNSSFSTLTRL